MPNIFNVAEVIDMGIEKERKRRDFYGRVAGYFKKNKAMKDLFTRLRDWEETHIKKFAEIRDEVKGETEVTESYQGEFKAYMAAIVDDKLYKEVSCANFAKTVKTPLIAVRYGIGFEKDAILFFNELASYMEGGQRDKISLLVDEEKLHIIYLTELKRKMEK